MYRVIETNVYLALAILIALSLTGCSVGRVGDFVKPAFRVGGILGPTKHQGRLAAPRYSQADRVKLDDLFRAAAHASKSATPQR